MATVERRPGPGAANDEGLVVRTPEHVELRFLIAGPGNRFLALLVDLFLQGLLFFGIMMLLSGFLWVSKWSVANLIGKGARTGFGLWLFALFILAFFIVQWGYFTLFETIWAGQTPGKRRQRLRVIREDGRPIGFAEAAIRNLLRSVLDSQPYPLHAIGFVVGMLNARFKRLGDFAAGTVVIVERRQSVPRPGSRLRAATQAALPETRPRVRQLAQEEVTTLQAYMRRRDELDPEVRSAMAQKVATSLMQRLNVAKPVDMSDDAFLEWLDQEVRTSQAFR
jgi:uncharacterized RDD family membrane protein YckC